MTEKPIVSIVMGSDSDLNIMKQSAEILREFGINFELKIISAHRTPERMLEYAKDVHTRGIKVVVAGAGGAAHLPGMIAAITPLPVIGVPIKSSNSVDGWDSILSILQMPSGVPVATVALNGATNAGILAAQICAAHIPGILDVIVKYKEKLAAIVIEKNKKIELVGFDEYGNE
jgi:5-(carboxyamino)imidazole ribonucleotide mutase